MRKRWRGERERQEEESNSRRGARGKYDERKRRKH